MFPKVLPQFCLQLQLGCLLIKASNHHRKTANVRDIRKKVFFGFFFLTFLLEKPPYVQQQNDQSIEADYTGAHPLSIFDIL